MGSSPRCINSAVCNLRWICLISRVFQRVNDLPSTGELDEATLAVMRQPRCGMEDTFNKKSHKFSVMSESGQSSASSYGAIAVVSMWGNSWRRFVVRSHGVIVLCTQIGQLMSKEAVSTKKSIFGSNFDISGGKNTHFAQCPGMIFAFRDFSHVYFHNTIHGWNHSANKSFHILLGKPGVHFWLSSCRSLG